MTLDNMLTISDFLVYNEKIELKIEPITYLPLIFTFKFFITHSVSLSLKYLF